GPIGLVTLGKRQSGARRPGDARQRAGTYKEQRIVTTAGAAQPPYGAMGSRDGAPAQAGDDIEPQPTGLRPVDDADSASETLWDGGVPPVPETGEMGPTGRPLRGVPDPPPPPVPGDALIVAMCNQKGGVGKTTSTINLGAALAEYGRRVLLVDLDPQGALSAGLGVAHHDLDLTVHNLLVGGRTSIDDVLMRTKVENMDLLPSNIDLSAAEIQLV